MRTPFCELHVHIEGTLEPETIFQLAEANGLPRPARDVAELRARYDFRDLQSFLDIYYENMAVLRTESDFFELGRAYLTRARADGVAHAEIFVDLQAHSVRGVPEAVVLRGLAAAIDADAAETGDSAALIVCVLRDESTNSAERMLDAALSAGVAIAGIGLDSAEVGHPPSTFRRVFEQARDAGLHLVAHAGEEGPAEYIWEALDVLGVERIDHGNRALDDAALVRRLVRDRVPLTMCPLSNVRLKVIPSLANFPLRQTLDLGLSVTINSDDPAYFGGYLGDNLRAVQSEFSLTGEEVRVLASNSIDASFASPERKTTLLAELDGVTGSPH
jgi:adenosine deaminase